MVHVVRWVVETKRGEKDHPWGPSSIIARGYFDSEEGAKRAMAASEKMGKLLGRTYAMKREEFDYDDELF